MNINKNAALLIIDMQQGLNDPRFGPRNNPEAESRLHQLLSTWRAQKRPIVHVRHISKSPKSVFWPGQSGVEFQSLFVPASEEHVVEKNVPDAFIATGLERWLRTRSIEQVVIAGAITNNSVESTARSSGNLGLDTIVLSDATYTFDLQDARGHSWPAEDVHALSLANLAMDYASILATADVTAMLE
ncbi:cysteine hydrolase family protein [Herbaspirillum sp. alder98]|uniref:cysteine hydrolase family protein n=1 Tax=Herbaspirillum sp. alder98 TaxID=2913096 RepID=UPI001CD89401|nr:cysteine hydrolase family protein [Herbaspirillum sp. alder98]MCA1322861.1 cysteine hydrolase [Herbaspirillum sp. alder98]